MCLHEINVKNRRNLPSHSSPSFVYPSIHIHFSFPSDNIQIVFGCSKHVFVDKQAVGLSCSVVNGVVVMERTFAS